MGVGVNTVIILSVAFFVFAIVGSMALNTIAVSVNSSVSTTVKTIAVTVTSILFAIGVALRFLPGKKGA